MNTAADIPPSTSNYVTLSIDEIEEKSIVEFDTPPNVQTYNPSALSSHKMMRQLYNCYDKGYYNLYESDEDEDDFRYGILVEKSPTVPYFIVVIPIITSDQSAVNSILLRCIAIVPGQIRIDGLQNHNKNEDYLDVLVRADGLERIASVRSLYYYYVAIQLHYNNTHTN